MEPWMIEKIKQQREKSSSGVPLHYYIEPPQNQRWDRENERKEEEPKRGYVTIP